MTKDITSLWVLLVYAIEGRRVFSPERRTAPSESIVTELDSQDDLGSVAPTRSLASLLAVSDVANAFQALSPFGALAKRSRSLPGMTDLEDTVVERNHALSSSISRRASALTLALSVLAPSLPALGVGAGTSTTGKSRPNLGLVLLEEASKSGNVVQAELNLRTTDLTDGLRANVEFESPWPLARTLYCDVETKNDKYTSGGSSFLQIVPLPDGVPVETAEKQVFSKSLFKLDGRFGAYGQPVVTKMNKDEFKDGRRSIDLKFTSYTPQGKDVNWLGRMTAIQAKGGHDALVLVSASPTEDWDKVEPVAKETAKSFKIVRTRATKIKPVMSSDVRYEKLGGLLPDDERNIPKSMESKQTQDDVFSSIGM